jgi:hypothetical protein
MFHHVSVVAKVVTFSSDFSVLIDEIFKGEAGTLEASEQVIHLKGEVLRDDMEMAMSVHARQQRVQKRANSLFRVELPKPNDLLRL